MKQFSRKTIRRHEKKAISKLRAIAAIDEAEKRQAGIDAIRASLHPALDWRRIVSKAVGCEAVWRSGLIWGIGSVTRFIPEVGLRIGRTIYFGVKTDDDWVEYGLAFDPIEVVNCFSFSEIYVGRENIHFPESRRIQDHIQRKIAASWS